MLLSSYAKIRAMLRAGIVGLPNVGKSTLFNVSTDAKGLRSQLPLLHNRTQYGCRHRAGRAPRRPLCLRFSKVGRYCGCLRVRRYRGAEKGARTGEGLGINSWAHPRCSSSRWSGVLRPNIEHVMDNATVRDIEVVNTEWADGNWLKSAKIEFRRRRRAGTRNRLRQTGASGNWKRVGMKAGQLSRWT